MKKLFLIILFIFISILIFSDYIVISDHNIKSSENNFTLYSYYKNLDIGLSKIFISGKNILAIKKYNPQKMYFIIENTNNFNICPDEYILLKDFSNNILIVEDNPYINPINKIRLTKIQFSTPIKRKNSFLLKTKQLKVDYSDIDSLSQYIDIDSLYNTDAILSGEYSYTSGWYSSSRFVDQPGCDSAIDYIYSKFTSYGLDSVFFVPFTDYFPSFFTGDSFTTKNIVAYKKGTYSSNECIVVGAHMDAVSQPYDDHTTIAPGADDNASGSSGVCEIARIFSGLNNEIDIYFVCFSGEEEGLCGSYAFIDSFISKQGKTVKGMINMDMIAYTNTSNAVRIYGMDHSAQLKNRFIDIGQSITSLTFYFYGSSGGSDHYPFELAGFPAAFAIEHEFSPVYHTSSDSISYMNFTFMRDIVRTAFGTTYYLANSPSTVQNIVLMDNGDSSIDVSWDKVAETNIINYNIYYSYGDSTYTLTVPDTNNYTLHSLIPDSLYTIYITAINDKNYEGLASDADTITPSFIPHNTNITEYYSDKTKIFLNYSSCNALDFDHFNIYRQRKNESTFFLIGTSTDTFFIDSTISDTSIYYYYVTVLDTYNLESNTSNIITCRLITLQNNNLIAFDETSNNIIYTDAKTDSFYSLIFNRYNIPVIDMDSVNSYDIVDFGNYSKIIIIDDDLSDTKINFLHFYKYIENGGNVIFIGNEIGKFLLNNPDSFPCNTNSTFYAKDLLNINSYNRNSNNDLDYSIYTINGFTDTILFDSDKLPFTSGGKIMNAGVFEYNNNIELAKYHSASNDTIFDNKTNVFCLEDTSVIIIDIPLYPMNETKARNFMDNILGLWNITGIKEHKYTKNIYINNIITNNTINISFEGFKNNEISISIFDISGRFVKKLFNGYINNNYFSLNKNINLSNGIYFINIRGINFSKNYKILKIQ